LNRLKKIFRGKCISCLDSLEDKSKEWTKYCRKCITIRRSENAHTSTKIRDIKRQEAFKSVERILKTGRRISCEEISILTGYKKETIIQMIFHSKLDIKRGYMYYV